MATPEPARLTRFWITVGILVLVGACTLVAWRVPPPTPVPEVAWDSAWVFRAEVFARFFVGMAILLSLTLTTIRTGRPPRKLSFGMVSYEEAEVGKAADALNEGQAALRAVQREVDGLRERLARTSVSARSAHEGLVALIEDDPQRQELARRSRDEIASLQVEEAAARHRDPSYEQAMAGLEARLKELDQMLARPRGLKRAG